MDGSAPNRPFHRAWLRTIVAGASGLASSSLKTRPRRADDPSVVNRDGVAVRPVITSGSPSPVRVRVARVYMALSSIPETPPRRSR